MKMSSMVGVCSAVALGLAVGTAQAGPNPGASNNVKAHKVTKKAPRPVVSGAPQLVQPSKIAGIHKLANGTYELTTAWMPYHGSGNDAQDTLVYDAAQVDDSGTPIGGGECGIPEGNRYILDDTRYAPKRDWQSANTNWNFTIDKQYNGGQSGRLDYLWYWNTTGTTFYLAFFTSEDVSVDCSIPAWDNGYDGVLLGYNNTGTGFWRSDTDISAYGLYLTLPSDGTGGIQMIIADSFDGQNLILAKGPTQPGLWGTANNGGMPNRAGTSTDPVWVDQGADGRSQNGTFEDFECFSYALGACPDPLCPAVSFWSEPGGNQCYPDCDGSGVLDFFDFLCYTNLFNSNDPYADCDGNGEFDFFDFLCYTNAFNAGCP
jgi:hypothetical protein